MTSLNIIGDSGKRKLRYDENLAHRINAETEKRLKKEELEEKLKKKAKPSPETINSPPKDEIAPPNNLKYSFLGDDFGKKINEKIQKKYQNIPAINQVVYDDSEKIVKGSTPFYVVAVNEIFKEGFPQFRTATQADLEKILKSKSLDLLGCYEDSSLVLRTKDKPNEYLAEDLFNQFKDKGINLKEDSVYVLPLYTLKLRKDNNSEHKLSFDITDLTINNYFEATILNSKDGSYINPSKMDENTGLPFKVYEKLSPENRQLWTRNSGLVRLYLYNGLNIDSDVEYLANCDSNGRVVVVSGEAAHAKI